MNFERRIKRLLSTVKHTLTLIVQTIRLILIQKLIVLWSLKKNIQDFYDVSQLFESSQNTQIKNTTSSNFYTHTPHTSPVWIYTKKKMCSCRLSVL